MPKNRPDYNLIVWIETTEDGKTNYKSEVYIQENIVYVLFGRPSYTTTNLNNQLGSILGGKPVSFDVTV